MKSQCLIESPLKNHNFWDFAPWHPLLSAVAIKTTVMAEVERVGWLNVTKLLLRCLVFFWDSQDEDELFVLLMLQKWFCKDFWMDFVKILTEDFVYGIWLEFTFGEFVWFCLWNWIGFCRDFKWLSALLDPAARSTTGRLYIGSGAKIHVFFRSNPIL